MSSSFILPIYCHSPLEPTLHTVSKHTNLKLPIHVCFSFPRLWWNDLFQPIHRMFCTEENGYRLIYWYDIPMNGSLYIYICRGNECEGTGSWNLYLLGILIAQNASFRYNGELRRSSRCFLSWLIQDQLYVWRLIELETRVLDWRQKTTRVGFAMDDCVIS